ncbi:hypothetical protein XM25_02675 [Devosia sp. H5989]|nr:hypothetical protein XM25_02675 [Devosia sp. H5989]
MSFQLKDWSLSEIRPHPTLPGRILAVARVTLREVSGGRVSEHPITLKVWTDAEPGTSQSDIEYALYVKAAELARRTMAAADITNFGLAAE